ncbi:MAG TPA: TIR domain-containing protein [Thermomicrobiales bacterium]|nr:TIR domain-containing protein [Thermomicrobiales bacterium]
MARHKVGSVGHLFLSYAAADMDRALAVVALLDHAGIPTWIDRRGITGGALWAAEISAAIRDCAALAILCTATSVNSRNVRQEVQLAWDRDRPILPILLEPVDFPDDIAYFLEGRQWIDAREVENPNWVDALVTALDSISSVSSAVLSESHQFVDGPGTLAEFPSAWQTHRIPVAPTPLVGRKRDLTSIVNLIHTDGARLVTLTGPGGVGKTRLAIAAATELVNDFSGGAAFVDLGSLSDAGVVPAAIATALGLRDTSGRPLSDVLAEFFRSRQFLLVLDNFEHVLAAARIPAMLLQACPNLVVICTSREPLRIRGEREQLVDPLTLPETGADLSIEQVRESEAVALFISRARDVKPQFELTAENASKVAEICRRLDGLPLAIELAAARIRLLSPAMLSNRLAHSLAILTEGARDAPDRQRTLRQTIAWSYDLLNPTEQLFFQKAAAFTGGFTLDAAEAVAVVPEDDVLEIVTSLVDKHLLRQQEGWGGEARFTMLETIREFADEQSPETEAHVSHAHYYLQLAEQGASALFGPDLVAWLDQLEAERDNFRAAFDWFMTQGDIVAASRLAASLHFFWRIRGPVSEGRDWVEDILNSQDLPPRELHANLLLVAGDLANMQGDRERAIPLLDESLALARESGSASLVAWALGFRGVAALGQSELASSRAFFEEALALRGYPGESALRTPILDNLGTIARLQGDLDLAMELHEQSLTLSRQIGFVWSTANIQAHLAHDACELGDYERAASLYNDSMRQLWARREHREFAGALAGFAELLVLAGQAERAARLCGAADALLEAIGVNHVPAGQMSFDRAIVLAEIDLGEEAFVAARTAGRTTAPDQILAEIERGIAHTPAA